MLASIALRAIHVFTWGAVLLSSAAFSAALSAQDTASNWPQWRGSRFDSVSTDTSVPVEFGKDKNLVYRVDLPGPGGASPVVFDGRAFVTSVDSDGNLWLIAFDDDGSEAWRRQLEGENRDARDGGNSASPSPSTDGEHVWVTTTAGFLQCFDWDGQPTWTVDLQARYGEFNIQFGMTSTPVLHDGKLYLQLIHGAMRDRSSTSTGTVACLDAATGDELWQQERRTEATMENKHSYASPVVFEVDDEGVLVTHGGDYVIGHSTETGKELWRCGGLNPRDNYNQMLRFVSSPVFVDQKLVVPSAKNGPVLCLDVASLSGNIAEEDSSIAWKMNRGTPDVASPVVAGEKLILARENGIVTVIDMKTGVELFNERLLADRHRSTPVVAGDRAYIAGRDGTVVVLNCRDLDADVVRNELGEETLASPAVADDRIFIRTAEALWCFGEAE